MAGTFRTGPASSQTISPVSPANGAVVAGVLPTLTWADSNRRTFYYEVQVSSDPTFGDDAFLYYELRHGAATTPPNSYTIPGLYPLTPGATYYWRVRPRVQGDGSPVAWSFPWSFVAGG